MLRLLLLWLLNALALWAVTYVMPSIHVTGFVTALIAAVVLGLLNTLVKPILAILTLPITILTLGLFYLVLNGFMFWLASAFLPGFQVDGVLAAILGALLYSVIAWVLSMLVPGK
jgi:putative membrane protein